MKFALVFITLVLAASLIFNLKKDGAVEGPVRAQKAEVTVHPQSTPTEKLEARAPASPRPHLAFENLLHSTMRSLPTLDDLASLSEAEAHGHPQKLKESAMALGEIAQSLKYDPTLVPQGLSFYRHCALREDLPRSLRALCLADFSQLSPQDRDFETHLPESVRSLAHNLL